LVMVASASMVTSERLFQTPFHFVFKQLIYLFSGLLIAFVFTRIPLRFWENIRFILLLGCIFLLMMVLIPKVGTVINGSRRWLRLGFITFQLSEAVKLMSILYLAGYLQTHLTEVQTQVSGFIKPLIFLSIIGFLLLLEPDFGATSVITLTLFVMLFIAGALLWPFLLMLGGALLLFGLLAVMSPYRLLRLTTFINPWLHAYSSGYQLTQSLIAFGRGGFLGVGLGNSIQKLFYLPEAHTDFIFAVIGEELGLAGEIVLIGLLTLFVIRVIKIAQQALQQGQLFAGFLAWGIALWISFQSFINIGVSIGLLPTKGLTLPFISYGGSSMWVICAAIGLVLRVAYEVQPQLRWREY